MDTNWLPCSVSPGQFPNEYAISGAQYNGKPFSLFAPQETVRLTADAGDGFLQVDILDRKGDLVLVRLPAQTFENGQYITVQAVQLRSAPQLSKVGA